MKFKDNVSSLIFWTHFTKFNDNFAHAYYVADWGKKKNEEDEALVHIYLKSHKINSALRWLNLRDRAML